MNNKSIKVRGSLQTDFYINESQVKEITFNFLYKKLNWGPRYFIKDKKVFENVEYTTSHRFDVEEFVRKATEEDYFAAGVIRILGN